MNFTKITRSEFTQDGVRYFLAQADGRKVLVVEAENEAGLAGFSGQVKRRGNSFQLVGMLSPENAKVLRQQIDWLKPHCLGLKTSAGMGDRLGLATVGHVKAVQAVGGNIAPIFAQQSIREMARTGRSPQEVMDDALWGVFEAGWRNGFGADADHLKTTADIDACLQAGFTFYTIDPGAYVNNEAEAASKEALLMMVQDLPQEMCLDACGLSGRRFDVEGHVIIMDEMTLLKAMAKYGRAVQHVINMYRHLLKMAPEGSFELEVSVDETELPTSHAEHLYIASELKRNGVAWVSLAPRYVGRFEKGVDYIGNLDEFEQDFAVHAAIARQLGPYKLSLHSGSDKFSIYPIAAKLTGGLVHLKTAGTSYLEALRTIATVDVALFAEIYAFSRQRYDVDKASYHVSADVALTPDLATDMDYPGLLEDFNVREVLHVTFGSVLTETNAEGEKIFFERFMQTLRNNADAYASHLESHFIRHLTPFIA